MCEQRRGFWLCTENACLLTGYSSCCKYQLKVNTDQANFAEDTLLGQMREEDRESSITLNDNGVNLVVQV